MYMKSYLIEVSDGMDAVIESNSKAQNISPQDVILQILNRFMVDVHIMEETQMQMGYEEVAQINLDWANL